MHLVCKYIKSFVVVCIAAVSLVYETSIAKTVNVTIQGEEYDITTYSKSYYENVDYFNLPSYGGYMPWWGNYSLAQEFALAVKDKLGYPYYGFAGPFFAVETFYSNNVNYINFYSYDVGGGLFSPSQAIAGDQTFAILSSAPNADQNGSLAPVPAPLPVLSAVAALVWSQRMRGRIKRYSTKN